MTEQTSPSELEEITRAAIETALAVINDSGEIGRETANKFLHQLQADFQEALSSENEDVTAASAATENVKDEPDVDEEARLGEVGRRLNQQRIEQLQTVIDGIQKRVEGLQTDLTKFGDGLADLEDLIKWASYADQETQEAEANMPYTSMDEIPAALKGIKPPINLQQANMIAEWADKMESAMDNIKNPWAVAIAQFKRVYEAVDGKWSKKTAKESDAPDEGMNLVEAMKTVDGKQYPASDFLVVEDPDKPTAWHLQVKRNGTPDHRLMGAAWAALHKGFRGNVYEGPDKGKAIDKLKALYKQEEMPTPIQEAEPMDELMEKAQGILTVLEAEEPDLDAVREAAQALVEGLAADKQDEELSETDGQKQETAEAKEAEVVEVDLSEAGSEAGIIGLAEGDASGVTNPDRAPLKVYVEVIKPGWGNQKDNRYYPAEMLKEHAHVFKGAKMYTTDHHTGDKSERTEVSVIEDCPVFFREGAPVALASIFDPDFAEKTRNRARAGQLETLRCSILGKGVVKPGFEKDGRKGDLVEAIRSDPKPDVDWVTRDGAGGHAVAVAESAQEPEVLAADVIETALSKTNLPGTFQEAIKARPYATEADLQEAITGAVAEVKKLTGAGEVVGLGAGARARERGMTLEERERRATAIQDKYRLTH